MKAVYMAIIIMIVAITWGQMANAEETNSVEVQVILDSYYNSLINMHVSDSERERHNAKLYGNDNVGYYKTQEEYCNMYDPAISALEY